MLVVCEGEKTEPNYFKAIRTDYRLSSANIEVTPAQGTDPMTIVTFAEVRLKDYEQVFCVFDRDGHSAFARAVERIRTSEAGRAGRWHAITSTPCFEVWVLLHFKYTTASFVAAGARSACDNVAADVRRHLLSFTKGDPSVYQQTKDRIDNAIANAKKLATHNADTGSTNPATLVHELVDYLRKLKSD